MTTSKYAVPTVLQIKLSAQQHHAFATCAKTCGLDLEIWILQCAEVKAAAVIDALQAPQRKERQSRKKQRPSIRGERAEAEEIESEEAVPGRKSSVSGREHPVPGEPAQSPTLEAARSYNARFRRKSGEARSATGRNP